MDSLLWRSITNRVFSLIILFGTINALFDAHGKYLDVKIVFVEIKTYTRFILI